MMESSEATVYRKTLFQILWSVVLLSAFIAFCLYVKNSQPPKVHLVSVTHSLILAPAPFVSLGWAVFKSWPYFFSFWKFANTLICFTVVAGLVRLFGDAVYNWVLARSVFDLVALVIGLMVCYFVHVGATAGVQRVEQA